MELNKMCITCDYWAGDKEEMMKTYEVYPQSMDKFKGWPTDGNCKISYEWITIDIDGDASVCITVDANFGCLYHSD